MSWHKGAGCYDVDVGVWIPACHLRILWNVDAGQHESRVGYPDLPSGPGAQPNASHEKTYRPVWPSVPGQRLTLARGPLGRVDPWAPGW